MKRAATTVKVDKFIQEFIQISRQDTRRRVVRMCKSFVAILVKEVALPNSEMLPVDTAIVVDIDESIAHWEDGYFDIFPDEYVIVN